MDDNDNNVRISVIRQQHLDWSAKQRRILTANGEAENYYRPEHGFAWDETELPHYHLLRSRNSHNNHETTQVVFDQWKNDHMDNDCRIIVGAWKRPLFYGGWEHSTDADEHVFNLQTESLFVDLRIPTTRSIVLSKTTNAGKQISSLEDLTADQLRYYARQHVFAGFSRITTRHHVDKSCPSPMATTCCCCARHHCIDWNFVGVGRSRPNKWWIETPPHSRTTTTADGAGDYTVVVVDMWKEWAYATDPTTGQHYYCERWERLDNTPSPDSAAVAALPVIALRKETVPNDKGDGSDNRDGVLVIVGDHFNYCIDRDWTGLSNQQQQQPGLTSLVDVVDAAIADNDLPLARQWLSMQGGHGRISSFSSTGSSALWILDCAIEFWKEGSPLFGHSHSLQLELPAAPEQAAAEARDYNDASFSVEDCRLIVRNDMSGRKKHVWKVFQSSLTKVADLAKLLGATIVQAKL